ncbi:MAG: glycoside hydrolase family 9 protein [Dysgonamonadaceae bacterium]|jgi:peptidoglycan/xylan/chitin deacetylase (PgdA/CDA1 family)|nr:glycoside hydrolase family 9 protein [Dysgonamonadaceae bacterium]
MKNIFMSSLLLIGCYSLIYAQESQIRINHLGYLPESVKVAVYVSQNEAGNMDFEVKNSKTGISVLKGLGTETNALRWGLKKAVRLNFSSLKEPGEYFISYNGEKSPVFRIGADVYDGSADFILKYMRQQRCGFNPYLDTLCHQHDGYIVDHPTRSGEKIDVRGGWHDASDLLQYLPTSANATFQMLFAWQQTPDKTIFKDEYDTLGKNGKNGVPDILDEARWGLEWLARMNPDSAVMFNQIADDRDHSGGIRFPQYENVDYGYGKGLGRPVYFITGEPNGTGTHRNRSTGVSSSAAKFSSAFMLGSEIFKDIDPKFAESIGKKALPAYQFGEAKPGNFQTACVVSPYFYEEDNWVDDMELAAATFANLTKKPEWQTKADYWGRLEEITPWMELGRARHYQFYPFVNLGHYYLALSDDPVIRTKYIGFMKKGLEAIEKRAKEYDDPFLNGIPFIWCSNNLTVAAITQAILYRQVTGDNRFAEMEAALRDWLFGCNPWGSSMIGGFPENADSPVRVHSSVYQLSLNVLLGGLVDGPIYRSLYESLLGINLRYDDPYKAFQFGAAVYHDDPGDYSSNEPTMDGTASLSFYLSSMEKYGKIQKKKLNTVTDSQGAVVKINSDKKAIHLIFSADEAFEGAISILNTLKNNRIKASFFLTGNCLRMKEYENIIERIKKEGHYIGGHSDKHLLYAAWEDRNHTLVSPDSLLADLNRNKKELEKFGIDDAPFYLPPYEHYNRENTELLEYQKIITINYTPGLRTAADYTTPDMKNYISSEKIIENLYSVEKEQGLNGSIILIHPGTEKSRTDKLYLHLDEIVKYLKKKGYSFECLKSY